MTGWAIIFSGYYFEVTGTFCVMGCLWFHSATIKREFIVVSLKSMTQVRSVMMCGSLNISLSLAFLAKHIPLASLFPSKSGLEKPNLPEDVSLTMSRT